MKSIIPFAIWAAFLAIKGPSFLKTYWETTLISFAVVVLVPLVLALLPTKKVRWEEWFSWARYLVLIGYLRFPEADAALWAVPYTAWAGARLLFSVKDVFKLKFSIESMAVTFIYGYWLTGALWIVVFLNQSVILGFDPIISHLTAAHFHLAGMVLTTVILKFYQIKNSIFHKILLYCAMSGMALVATGIVLTQMHYGPWLETISAGLFAIMGLTVAHRLIYPNFSVNPKTKFYWRFAGASLLLGAVLGALYGLRVVFPLPFINLENMKFIHGTVNAIGFGWCSIYGLNMNEK